MSGMFLGLYRLCSQQYLDKELTILKDNLIKLGYNDKFISIAMLGTRKKIYFFK